MIRLIASLLFSAPFSFTAWAQSAPAPQNDDALQIELALETPEGYKSVSLAQMEAFLIEVIFKNKNTTMPVVLNWEVVTHHNKGAVSYGLRADYSDGSSSLTQMVKTSTGKLVLDPHGETTRCYFKRDTPTNDQRYREGCCTPGFSDEGSIVCGKTGDCDDCQYILHGFGGALYEHKAFQ